jgi:AraC family transcriptional regulator, regulatory protein of adaptative response / methylated-DNA-[protein]-cysteine methyltransferase
MIKQREIPGFPGSSVKENIIVVTKPFDPGVRTYETVQPWKKIIFFSRIQTALGEMIACGMEEGICLLEFTDRKNLEKEFEQLELHFNTAISEGQNKNLIALQQQLDEYFEGTRMEFSLSLITPGTEFQQSVWRELQNIPYGITRSYKEQAEVMGKPGSVRAVAHANGMNRIAIVIPCHRVIGGDGSLTGYSGGLWRKKWLIEFEKGVASG